MMINLSIKIGEVDSGSARLLCELVSVLMPPTAASALSSEKSALWIVLAASPNEYSGENTDGWTILALPSQAAGGVGILTSKPTQCTMPRRNSAYSEMQAAHH